MAVKLRLQRKGRTKAPFYHIVAADARSPRDGRFIEKLGTYNPLTVPATIELNREAALKWMMNGAQPTDTVRAILRYKGVMFLKHLQVGVNKGAITQEQAEARFATWIKEKEGSVDAHKAAVAKKKEEFRVLVDGVAKVKAKPVVEEEAAPAEEAAAPAEESAEETPVAEAEAPATEETAE